MRRHGCGSTALNDYPGEACRRTDGRPLTKGAAPEAGDYVEAAVNHYKCYVQASAAKELAYFRTLPSDAEAISRAALAQRPDGKRESHQRRIHPAALKESERRLLDNLPRLRQATSFDDLHDLISALIDPIPGIGELTIYDTAQRIGARFGLEPLRVYIHAGTRAGARALGLASWRQTIEMGELPGPMQQLSAREVEDVLCIYKDWLGGSGSSVTPPG